MFKNYLLERMNTCEKWDLDTFLGFHFKNYQQNTLALQT